MTAVEYNFDEGQPGTTIERGVVVAASPLEVTLLGGVQRVPARHNSLYVPVVGDVVDVLRLGSNIVVIGASTDADVSFVKFVETRILVPTTATVLEVVLERGGDLTNAITAVVQTVGGTARAGDEYIDSAQTASWAAATGGTVTLSFDLVAPVAGRTMVLMVTSGTEICLPMQAVEVTFYFEPLVNWADVDNWLNWDALEAGALTGPPSKRQTPPAPNATQSRRRQRPGRSSGVVVVLASQRPACIRQVLGSSSVGSRLLDGCGCRHPTRLPFNRMTLRSGQVKVSDDYELERMAFNEQIRALENQDAWLDQLRARILTISSILIAASAVLLGASLSSSERPAEFSPLVAVGTALLCMFAWNAWKVLRPITWHQYTDSDQMLSSFYRDKPLGEAYAALAGVWSKHRQENQDKLDVVVKAVNWALVAVGLQIAVWVFLAWSVVG